MRGSGFIRSKDWTAANYVQDILFPYLLNIVSLSPYDEKKIVNDKSEGNAKGSYLSYISGLPYMDLWNTPGNRM
jgi:hypothetical protein